MTHKTLFGCDEGLCKWASNLLYGQDNFFDPKNSKAIGFLYNEDLIGAIIYNNLQEGLSIELSIATIDKRWATRHNLRTIFAYPFIQLGLERAQITTAVDNEGVNSLVSRLGFIKEGTHRKAYPGGKTAYSWGMLKDECRWIA